ncbi:TPA: hypothetical protein I8Y83_002757 [Legionella pneumophila]|uniref:Uncharacterized protein n=1 Tax=Legionella bozemanae TaxID=447 RepID=A0A0W0RER0_LEGBO|nr:hypothetical protein [Legionella bozemanae]KTC69568.1 hypothetical protein Lboz_3084 [Legionella bozemanae]STP13846.1 Uncharacterised protein [Legionella bozemanae]HAT1722206.1 hypothetical protein [Legionella pneumophila]
MNNSTPVSINTIYESAKLIIHSNNKVQDSFWRDYCTHVLTCLINHLHKKSEVTLSDCLDQLDIYEPMELMFKINVYNSKEKTAIERFPNQERFLASKANMAVFILTSTLKLYCDKGQYSHLFE